MNSVVVLMWSTLFCLFAVIYGTVTPPMEGRILLRLTALIFGLTSILLLVLCWPKLGRPSRAFSWFLIIFASLAFFAACYETLSWFFTN